MLCCAVQADLAAANMQTALSPANSLTRSLSTYEGQGPEALLQELRRLKNKLRQRGEELLQERQKVWPWLGGCESGVQQGLGFE